MKPARRTLLMLLSLCALPAAQAQPAASVPLEAARDALAGGRMRVIDIREPSEHAAGVAEGAQLLPMSQLQQRQAELPDKDLPVLLICRTQNRSKATALKLREAGYRQVQYVEGGMSEWVKRGWPTRQP